MKLVETTTIEDHLFFHWQLSSFADDTTLSWAPSEIEYLRYGDDSLALTLLSSAVPFCSPLVVVLNAVGWCRRRRCCYVECTCSHCAASLDIFRIFTVLCLGYPTIVHPREL